MKKIRKLTGKSAQEYNASLQANNVDPWINPINWILADLRLRLLLLMNIEPKYFHKRHRYPSDQRRLLDFLVIGSYEGDLGKEYLHRRGIVNDLRYRYLKFIYRSEFNQEHDWIKVTSSAEKNQIFIWHEDVDEYLSKNKAKV